MKQENSAQEDPVEERGGQEYRARRRKKVERDAELEEHLNTNRMDSRTGKEAPIASVCIATSCHRHGVVTMTRTIS